MIATTKTSWLDVSSLSERWVRLLLVVSAFAVPLSATAKSICLPLAVVLIILTPEYRRDLLAILSKPWCQATILLFIVVILACIWSPATPHERILFVEKYSKLLYLPILTVGFRDPKARQYGLSVFLVAMVITCLCSMLKEAGILTFNTEDPGNVFHNHIITGYMMVFATYLSALFFIRKPGKIRVLYAFLFLCFSYQILFISLGRTGFVVYIIMLGILILQYCPRQKAWLAMLVALALIAGIYSQSQTMQVGVNKAILDLKGYRHNIKDTALGHRLQFHSYAKNMFLRHPLLGNGTAGFTHTYDVEKPVASWTRTLLEPHSLYWLVAADFGLLGILCLLLFLGSLFFASLQLNSMRNIAIALLIPFLIGNLTDSLLFYSGPGYFFILFMALCFGEQLAENKRNHAY